jgi:hypothetical protein
MQQQQLSMPPARSHIPRPTRSDGPLRTAGGAVPHGIAGALPLRLPSAISGARVPRGRRARGAHSLNNADSVSLLAIGLAEFAGAFMNPLLIAAVVALAAFVRWRPSAVRVGAAVVGAAFAIPAVIGVAGALEAAAALAGASAGGLLLAEVLVSVIVPLVRLSLVLWLTGTDLVRIWRGKDQTGRTPTSTDPTP